MGTRERRERSDQSDRLISSLFVTSGLNPHEVAIAAVGSFGRGELAPGSDLDIVFVHSGKIAESTLIEKVNLILYPLWDSGLKIDHSVRTYSQTRDIIDSDLKVAMGLLDIRLICGNPDLILDIQNLALSQWRDQSKKYLQLLEISLNERHERSGELAYLLEPDLKESRGGLRDITALRAINISGAAQLPMERISRADSQLSTIREALHKVSGRDKDRLLFSEQDKVAAELGYKDADVMMSDVAQAARSVDYLMQLAQHRIHIKGRDGLGRIIKRVRSTVVGQGISVSNREVVIDSTYDLDADPVVGLRAAATAAQLGIRLSFESLQHYAGELKKGRGALSNPWPREAREHLISLIGAGPAMVEIFEALDQEEVIFQWIPEWSHVRSLPQRNALHRHTVDRHMVETAVAAAALTRAVHRPDLLLFTALFHDIGKGTEEDHSLRGESMIVPLASRIGFNSHDVEVIALLIRHHLLLSATATRRDLDDPATIAAVKEAIPNLRTLELLHALSIADGEATGKAAWSDWKATLVGDLVRRTKLALTDNSLEQPPEITVEQIERAATGELHVAIENRGNIFAIEIIVGDKTGLLSIVSGVLNVLRLDVRSARTRTLDGVAVMEWIAVPDPYAPVLTEEVLFRELKRAFEDEGLLADRIQARIDAYAQLPTIKVPAPVVEIFEDAATNATVIEVRSHDRPALLFAIGDAVRRCNIDIKSAIVTTLGAEAIDTLYVTEISGGALSPDRAAEVGANLARSLK
jgi:[protein-PII] uridylyltransferase